MVQTSLIRSVEARTIRVPLPAATSLSTRQVVDRDYVVCRLRTEDGVVGIGFCYGGSDAGSIVAKGVRDLLAPLLLNEDSTRTEWLWDRMYSTGLLQGRAGSVMRALSILDTALWGRKCAGGRYAAAPLPWRLP